MSLATIAAMAAMGKPLPGTRRFSEDENVAQNKDDNSLACAVDKAYDAGRADAKDAHDTEQLEAASAEADTILAECESIALFCRAKQQNGGMMSEDARFIHGLLSSIDRRTGGRLAITQAMPGLRSLCGESEGGNVDDLVRSPAERARRMAEAVDLGIGRAFEMLKKLLMGLLQKGKEWYAANFNVGLTLKKDAEKAKAKAQALGGGKPGESSFTDAGLAKDLYSVDGNKVDPVKLIESMTKMKEVMGKVSTALGASIGSSNMEVIFEYAGDPPVVQQAAAPAAGAAQQAGEAEMPQADADKKHAAMKEATNKWFSEMMNGLGLTDAAVTETGRTASGGETIQVLPKNEVFPGNKTFIYRKKTIGDLEDQSLRMGPWNVKENQNEAQDEIPVLTASQCQDLAILVGALGDSLNTFVNQLTKSNDKRKKVLDLVGKLEGKIGKQTDDAHRKAFTEARNLVRMLASQIGNPAEDFVKYLSYTCKKVLAYVNRSIAAYAAS